MSIPNDNDDINREDEMKNWENDKPRTVLSKGGKASSGGIAIVLMATVAIGIVFALKNHESGASAEDNSAKARNEITIASPTVVPELKVPPASSIPVPPVPPAPPPMEAQPDPLEIQREQLRMQQAMRDQQMQDARMKSSILLPANAQGNVQKTNSGQGLAEGSSNSGMEANTQFAKSVSGQTLEVSKATEIKDLDFKVAKGKTIAATLEPRANSDLPGMVCATVQQDVYGTQGREILIPWGSKVCGVYRAELRKGQDRLFVIWNELLRPDGIMVALDSPGSDQLGTAGMGGYVDTHFAEIFSTSALLAIIGAGAANVAVDSGDESNSATYYRTAVQQSAANSSQAVLAPYINIPPTIEVPHGARVTIYLNKMLDFTPFKQKIRASQGKGVRYIN